MRSAISSKKVQTDILPLVVLVMENGYSVSHSYIGMEISDSVETDESDF